MNHGHGTSQSKEMDVPPDSLVRRLLAHYEATRRAMPWRETRDPYAIWVSETMLQQTRVDAALPYYMRWIEQFPTIDALADADEAVVLRAWEGLGYYSRARNLHTAARVVRERYGGALPDTAAGLRALPGIGAYTAGAVSSIAFGRAEPAIDGNARRVYARILDLEDDAIPAIHRAAVAIVPADRPGDFNQAIMELGATICTPRPHCQRCPVEDLCLARVRGTIPIRPSVAPSKAVPTFHVATAVIIDDDGSTIVTQRPSAGLLAGFWEFPSRICGRSAVARNARELATALIGAKPPRARRIDPIQHAFSHRIEIYHPFVYRVRTTDVAGDVAAAAVSPSMLSALPLPVAQRRIASAAGIPRA